MQPLNNFVRNTSPLTKDSTYTIGLHSVQALAQSFPKDTAVLSEAITHSKEDITALFVTVPRSFQFLTEYTLQEWMQKKGVGRVFFNFARHSVLGISREYVIAWAPSRLQLAAAADVIKEELASEIQYITGMCVPNYDIGSVFYFALGPYRIALANTKKMDMFRPVLDFQFFLLPRFSVDNLMIPIPGYLLFDFNVGPEQAHIMYSFDSGDRPVQMISGGRPLNIHQYENQAVVKYWKSRGSLDRDLVNIYTCYPYSFAPRTHLTQQQLQEWDSTESNLDRIWAPVDKWSMLTASFQFGIGKYQSLYNTTATPVSVRKRSRIDYDEV